MLRLVDVGLTYAGCSAPVLSGVNLVLETGDRLGLAGPSGAGKSSLLALAAGLIPPTAGRVLRRDGVRIGLVLQEPEMALFARTVEEELSYAPRIAGLDPGEVRCAAEEALAALGLGGEILGHDPLRLPADRRRLVAVAAVLAGRPDALFLDEPTVGLGMDSRERLLRLAGEFPGAVIVAGHDLDFLWRLGGRVAVLTGGRLALETTWPEAAARPGLLTGAGLEPPEVLKVLAGLAARGWTIGDPGNDEAEVAAAIVAGGPRR